MTYKEAMDDIIRCRALMEIKYKAFSHKYAGMIMKNKPSENMIHLSIPAGIEINLLNFIKLSTQSDISLNIGIPLLNEKTAEDAISNFINEVLKFIK
jgi:hypothetical protein